MQNHFVTVCAPPAALNEMAPKVAAGARKKVDRRDPYRKLSSEEIRLAQLWHAEDDMGPSEIFSLQPSSGRRGLRAPAALVSAPSVNCLMEFGSFTIK